jgi:hypothetical protein
MVVSVERGLINFAYLVNGVAVLLVLHPVHQVHMFGHFISINILLSNI